MFRALKHQAKIYGRTMGQVRDTFRNRDETGMGTLTHDQFKRVMSKDLGLGLTPEQEDAFINAVDAKAQGVIAYDAVLRPLHMENADFDPEDVPSVCPILGMRRNEIAKMQSDSDALGW